MRERDANAGAPDEDTSPDSSRRWAGTPGQTIGGRYRLSAPLGRGGMGEVWRAKHLVTDRNVALKLLNRSLSERADMRQRFLREARAVAKVNHPNVIEVLDAFEDRGLLALVMPLLEGEALGSFLEHRGPLSVAAALEIFLPLVSAVDAAHAQGVVHRDLKPDNVFLVREGGRRHVKVLDFGIAKLMNPATVDGASLTATGSPIGTLWYMAPEQWLGDSTQDHRVDVWALGVILYEMLSGRRPIDGQNLAQVMKASLLTPIKPLNELVPGVPAAVGKLTLQMLSHDKSARPQSLQEVYERLLHHVPAHQRREWQRAQRDDTRGSSSTEARARDPQTIGNASTVRLRPTDHSMLSSVRPLVGSWLRHASFGAVGIAALAVVLVVAKRTSTPPDDAASVSTAHAALGPKTSPPGSVAPPPPANAAPTSTAPEATQSTVKAKVPPVVAASKRPDTGAKLSPTPATSAVDAKPQLVRTSAENAPRPIDKTNPFSAGGPSAAKRSFVY